MLGRITYDVPVVTQGANLICWVACMAMVASERQGKSVGVGQFTGGFDPSNASIPDPAGAGSNWSLIERLLANAGFYSDVIKPTAADIENSILS
jgi:hypothetical protein